MRTVESFLGITQNCKVVEDRKSLKTSGRMTYFRVKQILKHSPEIGVKNLETEIPDAVQLGQLCLLAYFALKLIEPDLMFNIKVLEDSVSFPTLSHE